MEIGTTDAGNGPVERKNGIGGNVNTTVKKKPTKSNKRSQIREQFLSNDTVQQTKRQKLEESHEQYILPLEFGWKRQLVYRSIIHGSSAKVSGHKLADVYYYSPSGKKLRSMPDIASHLQSNVTELTLSNFTFLKTNISQHKNESVRNAKARINDQTSFPPKTKQTIDTLTTNKASPKLVDTLKSKSISDPEDKPKPKSQRTRSETACDKCGRLPVNSANVKPVRATTLTDKSSENIERSPKKKKLKVKISKEKSNKIPHSVKSAEKNITEPRVTTSTALASPSILSLPSVSLPTRLCNFNCRGLENIFPTLQCKRCFCLFHPRCVGVQEKDEGSTEFTCKLCQAAAATIAASPCGGSQLSDTTSTIMTTIATIRSPVTPLVTSQNNIFPYPDTVATGLFYNTQPNLNIGTINSNNLSLRVNNNSNIINNNYINNSGSLQGYVNCLVLPQSPFLLRDTLSLMPPIIATSRAWGANYSTNNIGSPISPNFYLQNNTLPQNVRYQPLTQFGQTFTLATQPMHLQAGVSILPHSPLVVNQSQILNLPTVTHNLGQNNFLPNFGCLLPPGSSNVAVSQTRPITSPQQLKPKKSTNQSGVKNSNVLLDGPAKAGSISTNHINCMGELSSTTTQSRVVGHSNRKRKVRDTVDLSSMELTSNRGQTSQCPLPIFVHNSTYQMLKATISSNGVVMKISLPNCESFLPSVTTTSTTTTAAANSLTHLGQTFTMATQPTHSQAGVSVLPHNFDCLLPQRSKVGIGQTQPITSPQPVKRKKPTNQKTVKNPDVLMDELALADSIITSHITFMRELSSTFTGSRVVGRPNRKRKVEDTGIVDLSSMELTSNSGQTPQCPLPVFVHNSTSQMLEATISSSGVVMKITPPNFESFLPSIDHRQGPDDNVIHGDGGGSDITTAVSNIRDVITVSPVISTTETTTSTTTDAAATSITTSQVTNNDSDDSGLVNGGSNNDSSDQ